jgi:transposase
VLQKDSLANAAQDGLALQKKSSRALEQDRPDVALKRKDWQETQGDIDPERLVFLDETGLKTDLTRLHGWIKGGQRLVEAIPASQWQTNTLVHAVALDGTRAAMVLDGPINSESFVGFCQWLLAPSLHPGDLVVLDNLSSHKSAAAIRVIEAVGAQFIYLPPYSPDLNPIENIFSKLKQLMRGFRPRSFREIVKAAKQALLQITQDDLEAVFTHCGYGTAY